MPSNSRRWTKISLSVADMKNVKVAFFMLFLFAVNVKTLMAQEWLIFKIYETGDLHNKLPFFDDYFYSEIAYARTSRSTALYELEGKVKSVIQTSFLDSVNINSDETLVWEFDKNQNLVKFSKGDSSVSNDWMIEEYVFDESNHLINRRVSSDRYGEYSYAWYTYDIRGYLTERIDSFSSYDGNYYSQAIFNYENDYQNISCEYFPLSDDLFWSFENFETEIKYDEMGRYISPGRNVDYDKFGRPTGYFINNGCGSNSALCIQVNTKYDERGNVIEQTVHDMTTRNSLWSFSSHFKAEYNEKNLVIRREETPYDYDSGGQLILLATNSDMNAETQTSSLIYTFDYRYDHQGNWIRQVVYLNGNYQSEINRTIAYY